MNTTTKSLTFDKCCVNSIFVSIQYHIKYFHLKKVNCCEFNCKKHVIYFSLVEFPGILDIYSDLTGNSLWHESKIMKFIFIEGNSLVFGMG